jgi:hypothetical protein
VLDHAVGVDAEPGLALGLRLEVREDVHPGGVPPEEEGLVVLLGALVHEVERLDVTSSSIVSMRFLVSGPVSVMPAVGEAVDDAARPETSS